MKTNLKYNLQKIKDLSQKLKKKIFEFNKKMLLLIY